MRRLIIGHRGVGKTQLLKRHKSYFPEIQHFDLDQEIESFFNIQISQYFADAGEASFRKKEKVIFEKIIRENNEFVISLGAGFETSNLPAVNEADTNIEIIYVSRITDEGGRIFLNRPRLEMELSPLAEYKKRYDERHKKYINAARKIYHMPEGLENESDIEKMILKNDFEIKDAFYTLTEQELQQVNNLIRCYKKIELRTDLLTHEVIENLLNQFPNHEWLISIRTNGLINLSQAKLIDADVKFYDKKSQIVSSHADQIDEGIKELQRVQEKVHLKLCPLVDKFADLMKGYYWQQVDPNKRSFLPRSYNGKWVWYRQLAKYWQKINFVRGFTEIRDQPSLFEWLSLPDNKPNQWAAVIGQPLYFSRSPNQHLNYFSEHQSFFTKIELDPDEFKRNIKFLNDLGLTYLAVTSPLKEIAFKVAEISHGDLSASSKQFKAVNTIYLKNLKMKVENTDLVGFTELVKSIKSTDRVAIWGGGGTLDMMKWVLPEAHLYSSQTGCRRESPIQNDDCSEYDFLIWAAPRTDLTKWPSDKLKIKTIIDLNYTDNSMGLEYAARYKLNYISGLEMFKRQAKKQQEFWSSNECE